MIPQLIPLTIAAAVTGTVAALSSGQLAASEPVSTATLTGPSIAAGETYPDDWPTEPGPDVPRPDPIRSPKPIPVPDPDDCTPRPLPDGMVGPAVCWPPVHVPL